MKIFENAMQIRLECPLCVEESSTGGFSSEGKGTLAFWTRRGSGDEKFYNFEVETVVASKTLG